MKKLDIAASVNDGFNLLVLQAVLTKEDEGAFMWGVAACLNAQKNYKKTKKDEARTASLKENKLHLPRYANLNMCGFKSSDARSTLDKITDFWADTKGYRCAHCLAAAKIRGDDTMRLIREFGGVK